MGKVFSLKSKQDLGDDRKIGPGIRLGLSGHGFTEAAIVSVIWSQGRYIKSVDPLF